MIGGGDLRRVRVGVGRRKGGKGGEGGDKGYLRMRIPPGMVIGRRAGATLTLPVKARVSFGGQVLLPVAMLLVRRAEKAMRVEGVKCILVDSGRSMKVAVRDRRKSE